MKNPLFNSGFVRSFVFGVEDSLVSTIGLISGVAAADASRSFIIMTGLILVFVEAFSMAVGTLLSENSVQEFNKKSVISFRKSFGPAVVMFISYFIAGLIVVSPYLILPSGSALIISITSALFLLFILGVMSAEFSHTSKIKKGITMVIVGGLAIGIGIAVGTVLNRFRT